MKRKRGRGAPTKPADQKIFSFPVESLSQIETTRARERACARVLNVPHNNQGPRERVCVCVRPRERARLCVHAHARAGLESITYAAAAAGYFSSSPSSFFLCLETIFNEKGKRGRDKDGILVDKGLRMAAKPDGGSRPGGL